jgi:hypothetical protein
VQTSVRLIEAFEEVLDLSRRPVMVRAGARTAPTFVWVLGLAA